MAETYSGEFYCVKCKAKREASGDVHVNDKGTRMAKAKCPVCGTNLNRILGRALTAPRADSAHTTIRGSPSAAPDPFAGLAGGISLATTLSRNGQHGPLWIRPDVVAADRTLMR